jgi:oxygen-dependent protoporphyrinogen oxidase
MRTVATPPKPLRCVVIGGGITGLTAARTLARSGNNVSVTLVESAPRLGGNIITERRDGFLIDGGPDSFVRTKPPATLLAKELGLGDALITTSSRHVFLVHDGALVPMPAGMALAVPTRLGPMLNTPLLSLPGKLRVLGDLLLPRGAGRGSSREESVFQFVARRFGREAADRLAGPLLGGIYAGDVMDLGIEATFPQLPLLEERYGSLILGLYAEQRARSHSPGAASPAKPRVARPSLLDLPGAWRWLKRAEQAAPSPFYSLAEGMGSLIDGLARELPEGSVYLGLPARRLVARGSGGFRVECVDGVTFDADAVILACPAHVAARLLPESSLARTLSEIDYVSTATVFFALDRAAVAHSLDGVGFVAPRGTADIVAGTWVSSKWAGRAPDGCVLVRAFLGGASGRVQVDELSNDDLAAIARRELERLMGPLGTPLFERVFRYSRSNPQPKVGHLARLERIEAALAETPGIYVAGAAYEGVGIPDCVRQGRAVAERALRERARGC